MEYNMVQEFLVCIKLLSCNSFAVALTASNSLQRTPDFYEGVTALLVEKRAPKWNPSWDEMTDKLPKSIIQDAFFAPRSASKSTRAPDSRLPKPNLEFLNGLTFFEYPHRTLSGFPREQDIENVIVGKVRRVNRNALLAKDEHVMDT
jgi:3-hydroxyisobutyryl-CoA hydrolase